MSESSTLVSIEKLNSGFALSAAFSLLGVYGARNTTRIEHKHVLCVCACVCVHAWTLLRSRVCVYLWRLMRGFAWLCAVTVAAIRTCAYWESGEDRAIVVISMTNDGKI